jgi:hypothetical protein
MAGGTGVVSLTSDLVRQKWMREGLIQATSKSFWSAYQGGSMDSIVYQENNISASEGHTVVFDFDGHIVGSAVKGKETAFGTGETKKKFSDKVTVDRYRFVVDNGDKFDGVNIGDLSINEHTDSRNKLSDLWVRVKDQAITDTLQQSATHRIITDDTSFTFDDLLDVENTIKTGVGYTQMASKSAAAKRLPLKPFMLADGRPVWLFVVDSYTKNKLMKSTGAQQVFREADVRGNENRLIKSVIGKVGNFLFVEADTFFGTTASAAVGDFVDSSGYAQLNKTKIQMCGLRQYTDADDGFVPESWTGDGLAAGAKLFSRNLILGAGAMQLAMGKMPDYKFQASTDFGITSQSALETWCGFKATKFTAENDDYAIAIGGISHGVVAFDVQID